MGLVILIIIIGCVAWYMYKTSNEKASTEENEVKPSSKNKKEIKETLEYENLEEMYENIDEYYEDIVGFKKNIYMVGIKIDPSNYLLKSGLEKDVIDSEFETMLATLPDYKTHEVRFFSKGVYEDLSENIEEMKENLNSNQHLTRNAVLSGKAIIQSLEYTQMERPRIKHENFLFFIGQYSKDDLQDTVLNDESTNMKEKLYGLAREELVRMANRTVDQLTRANCQARIMRRGDYIANTYNSFNKRTAHAHPFIKQEKSIQENAILTSNVDEDKKARIKAMVNDNLEENNVKAMEVK